MTRLNSAGFELNSNTTGVEFATCNGTGATIQGTTKRTGSYAGKILDPASGVRTGWSMFCDNSTGDDKKARAYIYIVAYPDVNTTILSFEETSSLTSDLSHTSGIRLKTDGKLQLINGSGTQIGSDSGVLSLNTWYRIELQAENAAANNLAEGLIDGSSFASTAVAAFAGDANRFLRIGANMRAEACTSGEWYFDDIACNVVSGSVQNDWPGAGSLDLVLPDGAGDYAEGADGAGGGAAWQEIDEIPPDDATTYWLLQANSTNASTADRLAVTLGAMSSATSVTLAQAIVRAMPDTNAACSFTLGFKTQASGTLVEGTNTSITGTAWVTHDDTSTSKAPKLTVYTDPQGGGALTETLINGSQLQIRCPDATPDVRVTFLGLYVEYVPGSGGTTYNESGSGGISFGGAATVLATYNVSGSGGITYSGAATPQGTYNLAGSGTLTLDGSATVQRVLAEAGSGGLVLSGAAAEQATFNATGAGGLSLAGSADVMATYSLAGSGGLVLDGAADVSRVLTESGAGGLVLAGLADVQATFNLQGNADGNGEIAICKGSGGVLATVQCVYNPAASGGVTLAGDATAQATYNTSSDGGVVFSGEAIPEGNNVFNEAGSGGVVLSGEGTAQAAFNTAGSGGGIFGGTATVMATYNILGNEDGNGEIAICKGTGGHLATVQCVYNTSGSGGVALGGSADVSGVTNYNEVGSGGIVLGGTAIVSTSSAVGGELVGEIIILPTLLGEVFVTSTLVAAAILSPSLSGKVRI